MKKRLIIRLGLLELLFASFLFIKVRIFLNSLQIKNSFRDNSFYKIYKDFFAGEEFMALRICMLVFSHQK
jgi:hypothetical protein